MFYVEFFEEFIWYCFLFKFYFNYNDLIEMDEKIIVVLYVWVKWKNIFGFLG